MITRTMRKSCILMFIFLICCIILLWTFYIVSRTFPYPYCHHREEITLEMKWEEFDIVGRDERDFELINYLIEVKLIQPNSLPYKLDDPYIMDPESKELAILAEKVVGRKRNGVFFEAGAYHPESHSMTVHLERFLGWTGLLVEPDPANFEAFQIANRKAKLLKACISPNKTAIKVNLTSDGLQSKIATDDLPGNETVTYEVECFPIYSILLSANMTWIDYFVLDVEGMEMEILRTLPFQSVKVDAFVIEHFNNPNPEEVVKFLEDKGYKMVEETEYDYIFVKNNG